MLICMNVGGDAIPIYSRMIVFFFIRPIFLLFLWNTTILCFHVYECVSVHPGTIDRAETRRRRERRGGAKRARNFFVCIWQTNESMYAIVWILMKWKIVDRPTSQNSGVVVDVLPCSFTLVNYGLQRWIMDVRRIGVWSPFFNRVQKKCTHNNNNSDILHNMQITKILFPLKWIVVQGFDMAITSTPISRER